MFKFLFDSCYALISFLRKINSKLSKKCNKKPEYFSFSKPTVNASTLSFLLNHSNKKNKTCHKIGYNQEI